ncbi:hypothetical protein [Rhodoferax sp. GW822-FHT02A01]|uniref:hypothetical protein n=1 Tax=Rhodoferax sp. GW822-FHT02A01 TaxID=3141537 RepID=UPI00315DC56A
MLEDSIAFAIVNGRFPRVGHMLQEHWEDPDFMTYMEDLLQGDQFRKRFPREVDNALHCLMVEHDVEFPNFTSADRDF